MIQFQKIQQSYTLVRKLLKNDQKQHACSDTVTQIYCQFCATAWYVRKQVLPCSSERTVITNKPLDVDKSDSARRGWST